MGAIQSTAHLRLVRADDPPRAAVVRRPRARLEATDARWVLAVRAREALEGGRAAVLPPERRARLNDLGRRLGLRPFDVSLIIAIVQDEARTGGVDREGALERLAMVPRAGCGAAEGEVGAGGWWTAWMGAAVILAMVMTAAGMAWLSP